MPPKLIAEELAPSIPGVCPVPDSATVSEGFEASLAIFSVPTLLPPDDGANARLKLVLCPGVSVMGTANPDTLNPAPEMEACETVTVDPPEFVNVSG